MNLSVFELAYLGSQPKDTAHMGKNNILKFANSQFVTDVTDMQWMRLLGISPSPDWPLARLLWLAEANNVQSKVQQLDANRSLLLAQPVFLSLQRDSFALESVIALSADEFKSITALLNNHFKQEDIDFIPSQTQQYWFMQTPMAWQLNTYSLQSVLRQNIQALMPQGPDANKLRQIFNQVQMLLHEHPVNQQRLQQGQPELNSVWFSGNSLPNQSSQLDRDQTTALIGENALSQGISAAYQIPNYPDLDAARNSGIKHAVMLADELEKAPWDAIFGAVKSRKIQGLTLYCPAGNATLQFKLQPLDCWKFWRKPTTLSDLLMQHVQNH